MGRSDCLKLPDETSFLRNPCAQKVCRVLEEAGHDVFFVGGAVRNALIKAPISDLDLSTDARPERVMELYEASGLRTVPTGVEHGTVTVVCDGEPFEITTFRRDVKTDGRRAVVAFADTIEEDARRRDFTMNALYATPNGQIIDPVGGVADALSGRVVFIDKAETRIREDYLRILRFFRFWTFYARQEDGFDAQTLSAITENLDGLESLSAERIGTEISKLLSAPDPSMAIATMEKIGVMSRILPVEDSTRLPVLIHWEKETITAPDPIRRLAVLGPQQAPGRLRLSKRDSHDLAKIQEMAGLAWGPKALGALLGPQRGWDVLLLRAASLGTTPAGSKHDVEIGAETRFPLKAQDLAPRFEGPALGAELKRLRDLWLKSELRLDKAALLG